jgi:alpha-glucosidase (family GH31 glycosyl hydrolase)
MTQTLLQLPCQIPFLEGEYWWGGRTADGVEMPFSASSTHRVELHTDLRSNQAAPFLVSSHGRYLWSEHPFCYEFRDSAIFLTGSVYPILLSEGHETLAAAFRAASKAHFPPAGKTPPGEFFSAPQYNTWIELNHNQTQQGVLEYARGLIENGYSPGVFMIDAGWSEYFGHLDFHPGRFPDPHAMVRELKDDGFKVMLWVSPYFSADSREYRRWRDRPGWLLRNRDGTPAVLEWWDGYSVHLDITHPEAVAWFHGELRRLQRDYGIDGFKFDAGDALHFKNRPGSWLDAAPVDLTQAWARIGMEYPYNEFRACWKMSGQPIVQRLHDRAPAWDESGLASLIPNGIAMGLIGHPFLCPDMVGGGDYLYFTDSQHPVDEELFVRCAQTSALFPMVQFSSAPWRVLSLKGLELCKAAVRLRASFVPLLMEEAKASSVTGQPILRSLEYEFPHQGYADIKDQFMVGSTLMVAPVLSPGVCTRKVAIPPGTWRDDRGETITGPKQLEIETPLARLPHWIRA